MRQINLSTFLNFGRPLYFGGGGGGGGMPASQVQAARSNDELAWEERAKTEIYALDAEGNAYSPAWYTLNARASMELKYGVTLNVGLENITDQRYRPYSSGISGAGRNAVVALAARF